MLHINVTPFPLHKNIILSQKKVTGSNEIRSLLLNKYMLQNITWFTVLCSGLTIWWWCAEKRLPRQEAPLATLRKRAWPSSTPIWASSKCRRNSRREKLLRLIFYHHFRLFLFYKPIYISKLLIKCMKRWFNVDNFQGVLRINPKRWLNVPNFQGVLRINPKNYEDAFISAPVILGNKK